MAKRVIDSNRYMVLGTADETGVPWATPVWFAHEDYRRFVWLSAPDRRHSRNVRARSQISIVIFDSQVIPGSAEAVYMEAVAEELAKPEQDIELYTAATRAQNLPREWTLDDVLPPAPRRLYRAIVSRHWVLDPAPGPDDRADVTL